MTKEQEKVNEILKKFSHLSTTWPTYPPYHTGLYFEEYFIQRFLKEKPDVSRVFLPIHWTAVYKRNMNLNSVLQKIEDMNIPTFTVSTHDDAPRESIKNNISFSAGGNNGDIPIPLIVSLIPKQKEIDKTILCSFKGSITHPIRHEMERILRNEKEYVIETAIWKEEVHNEEQNRFIELMNKSVFSLCPRGYGKTSYRLYEALQLGSIPVYISDEFWLPMEEKVDWTTFSILISKNDLGFLDHLLRSYTLHQIEQMRTAGKEIYEKYFTFEKVYDYILEKIK